MLRVDVTLLHQGDIAADGPAYDGVGSAMCQDARLRSFVWLDVGS